MSVAMNEVPGWSRKTWGFYIVIAAVVQIGLLLWVSDYRSSPLPRPSQVFRLQFGTPRATSAEFGQSDFQDPTLFALPTAQGFSGPAWLRIPPFRYSITNSVKAPIYLGPPIDSLVDDFEEFLQTNSFPEGMSAIKTLPALARGRVTESIVTSGPTLRLDGDLNQWHIVPSVKLPEVPDAMLTITNNTVVRVVLLPTGKTFSAVLVSRCGIASADQEALLFAQRTRFVPDSIGKMRSSSLQPDLVSGDLIFQWFQVGWGERVK